MIVKSVNKQPIWHKRWRDANPDKVKAAGARYRNAHKTEIRARAILKSYGLSQQAYQDLIAHQSNKCALCYRSFDEFTPHIDHDHATGKVRGLLCMKCNTALGVLGDSVEALERVLRYLK